MQLFFNTDKDIYIFKNKNGDTIAHFNLTEFVKDIRTKVNSNRTTYNKNIFPKYMYLNVESESYQFKIFVRSINGEIKGNKIKINDFDASLLIAYPQNAR